MKSSNLSTIKFAGLFLFGILLLIGCLKEGKLIDSSDDYQLVVVPSAQEVNVGEVINFDILLLGEIVDADIYINSSKISGHEYIFQEPGIYTIYAEREGVKNSDSIEIQVRESINKLKLEVSATEITAGDSVSFTTFILGDKIPADIYVNSIKLSDNIHVFADTGTFEAYALKDGYINSDTLEITVHSKGKLILTASSLEIKVGDKDTFHVTVDGKQVIDADIYVEDTKISDSIYRFDEAGTYNVYALKDGFANSDTLSIKVTDVQLPKLSLLVTKTKIMVGEQLSLSPMYMQGTIGSRVKDAKVYVGGKLVEAAMEGGYPFIWWSDEPGSFKAYAQKEGYENSDTLEIVVENAPRKLVVIPSDTNVTAGTDVTFSVKMMVNGKEQPAPDAQIYVHDSLIIGYQYTFKTPGSYKVVAKGFGGGILDSDPITVTVTENTNSLNVKVVGYEGYSSSSKAMLWNGSASQAVTLGAGAATGIFNFHGGIYISGYESNGIGNTYKTINAKYWDNNHDEVILESGISRANSIMVEPTDGGVVVGGSIGADAVYWIWGKPIKIGSETGAEIALNDAVWKEGSIYAVGNTDANGQSKATIWAFGDRWGLYYNGQSHANAIVLANGDYYVAGSVGNKYLADSAAVFWKGGNIHSLSTPDGLGSVANDIVVKDNNVYVAGGFVDRYEKGNAVVWINNKMAILNNSNEYGGANAIAVASDGTIFVAGWVSPSSTHIPIATCWHVDESGNILKRVSLTDGTINAEATGIILSE